MPYRNKAFLCFDQLTKEWDAPWGSILEGKQKVHRRTGGGHPFKTLTPCTDGTLAYAQQRDLYHGAPPDQPNPGIRKRLENQVIPSSQSDRPIAPNFIEVKGHAGSVLAARRQACYYGALGARGWVSRAVRDPSYTVDPDYPTGYVMPELGQWALHSNAESFQQGITASRNARDLAEEHRNEFIKQANERYASAADGIEERPLVTSEAGEVTES